MAKCVAYCFAGLLILPVFSGCADKPAEITTYRVPAAANIAEIDTAKRAAKLRKQLEEEATVKQERDSLPGNPHDPDAKSPADEKPVKGRMLAAIIPKAPQAWFLKLSGPLELVSAQSDSFRKFLSELKFEGDRPKWTVPAGWKELPADSNRFATLQIPVPDHDPLELTVTALGFASEMGIDGYLTANVNRWRGQMGLDPSADQTPSKSLEQFPLATNSGSIVTAYFIDLEGILKPGGMMPPFARGFGSPAKRPRSTANDKRLGAFPARPEIGPAPQRQSSPIKYDKPEGWQAGELRPPRLAALAERMGGRSGGGEPGLAGRERQPGYAQLDLGRDVYWG